jgi:phosphatidylglycerophosphate synthase
MVILIMMMIMMIMLFMEQYNWYAVMGITTTESATPTTEEILARKKTSPRLACSTHGDWTTVTTFIFREASRGNVGDKMKEVGTTPGWVIIMVLLTVVVLQLFRGYRYDSGTYVAREGGRSLVEFNSGQRNQRRFLSNS